MEPPLKNDFFVDDDLQRTGAVVEVVEEETEAGHVPGFDHDFSLLDLRLDDSPPAGVRLTFDPDPEIPALGGLVHDQVEPGRRGVAPVFPEEGQEVILIGLEVDRMAHALGGQESEGNGIPLFWKFGP